MGIAPIQAAGVLFLGRTTVDALYWLESIPEENTKVYAQRFLAAPGGPAMNAAITHALLGGQSQLVSAVGAGPWAGLVRAELKARRIGLLDLAAGSAYETPLCSVLVNRAGASRSIVNPPMSEVNLRRLAAWQQEGAALGSQLPSIALTDGFFLNETHALLASLRDAGVTLCLDGGSYKPGTDELASLLTVAICSERFAVPGHAGPVSNPEAIIAWFAAHGLPYIAVTRGAESILGWDRGRRFEIEIPSIVAVDTLGAGDVLHGAFCRFFAQQPDFEPALRRASEIATLSCRSLGIRAWAAEMTANPA
jgi:sugar/nucleoside kinase (ribokinase family)